MNSLKFSTSSEGEPAKDSVEVVFYLGVGTIFKLLSVP